MVDHPGFLSRVGVCFRADNHCSQWHSRPKIILGAKYFDSKRAGHVVWNIP